MSPPRCGFESPAYLPKRYCDCHSICDMNAYSPQPCLRSCRSPRSARLSGWTPRFPMPGESAGGVSPPAALRTGRDSLPSSGPHSPALGKRDELPVGEQARLVLIHLLQPGHRFGVLAAESPELVHGPPDQVLVDAPCQETQLGAVEGPVIVDPALDLGVDLPGQAEQVRAAAAVEVPVPDLPAFRFLRRGADGRGEASEIASAALGQAAPAGIAEEIEAGVPEVPPAVRVLAVRNLRLRGVQLQAQGPEPPGDGGPRL